MDECAADSTLEQEIGGGVYLDLSRTVYQTVVARCRRNIPFSMFVTCRCITVSSQETTACSKHAQKEGTTLSTKLQTSHIPITKETLFSLLHSPLTHQTYFPPRPNSTSSTFSPNPALSFLSPSIPCAATELRLRSEIFLASSVSS